MSEWRLSVAQIRHFRRVGRKFSLWTGSEWINFTEIGGVHAASHVERSDDSASESLLGEEDENIMVWAIRSQGYVTAVVGDPIVKSET